MKRQRTDGYLSNVGASVRLLSDTDMEQIHLASIHILGQIGIGIGDEGVRKMLIEAGAMADDGEVVFIPENLINEAIRTAPGNMILGGLDEKYDCYIEKGRSHFLPVKQPCYINDIDTGEYRLSTIQDVRESSLVIDALDEYDMNDGLLAACDVPPEVMDYHIFKAVAENTSKYVLTIPAKSIDRMEYFLDMAITIAGSKEKLQKRPLCIMGSSIISPLYIEGDAAASLVFAAQNNIPSLGGTMAMSGGTGPASIAGCLAMQNAELLAGLVITQIARPGAPYVCGSSLGMLWLKNASASVGSPEAALLNAGAAQMAELYNLPCMVGGT